MKIKDVCHLTGLTDRAVRYYIENGLVFPTTGENYTGRRSFTFSDEDVLRLRRIALLRKAGFGIEQIRGLFAGDNVQNTVRDRIDALSAERDQSLQILRSLQEAETSDKLTVEELTHILETPAGKSDVPKNDSDPPFVRLLRNAKRTIVGLCIGICALLLIMGFLIFGVFDGAEFINRRISYGEAVLTVVIDGEVISSDKFAVKELYGDATLNDKDVAHSYGYTFDSSYGIVGGVAVLEDGTEIEFGFTNSNNWHDPHIILDVTRDLENVTIRQTVTFRTEKDLVTADVNETTASAGSKRISVLVEGLL